MEKRNEIDYFKMNGIKKCIMYRLKQKNKPRHTSCHLQTEKSAITKSLNVSESNLALFLICPPVREKCICEKCMLCTAVLAMPHP